MTLVSPTPSPDRSCRGQDGDGGQLVVLFDPLPTCTTFLLEAKADLYPPFALNIFFKKYAQLLQKKCFNLLFFFLIAQSVLNAQDFHSFPTRLGWKAKNSKQAS